MPNSNCLAPYNYTVAVTRNAVAYIAATAATCTNIGSSSVTAFEAAITGAAPGQVYSTVISGTGGQPITNGQIVLTQVTPLTLGTSVPWTQSGTGPPSNSPFALTSTGPAVIYFASVWVPNPLCSMTYNYTVAITRNGSAYASATPAICTDVGTSSMTALTVPMTGATAGQQFLVVLSKSAGGSDITMGQVAATQATTLSFGSAVSWTKSSEGPPASSPFLLTSGSPIGLYYVYVSVPNAGCSTAYNYTVTVDRDGLAYIPTTQATCANVGAMSVTAFGTLVTGATSGQQYSVSIFNGSSGSAVSTGSIVATTTTSLTLGVISSWTASSTGPPNATPFTFVSAGATINYFVYVSVPNANCSTTYNYIISITLDGSAYIPATVATCTDVGASSVTAFEATVTGAAAGQLYSTIILKGTGGTNIAGGQIFMTQVTPLTIGTPVIWSKTGTGPPSNSPFTYMSTGPTVAYNVLVSVPNPSCSATYTYTVAVTRGGIAYIPATVATCDNIGAGSETALSVAITGAEIGEQYSIAISNSSGGSNIVAGQIILTQVTPLVLGTLVAWTKAGAGAPSNSPFTYVSAGPTAMYYVSVSVPNPSCSATYNYTVAITRNGSAYVPETPATCSNVGASSETAFEATITGAASGQQYSIAILKGAGGSDISTGQIVMTQITPLVLGTVVTWTKAGTGPPSNSPFTYASADSAIIYYVYVSVPNSNCLATYSYTVAIALDGSAYMPATAAVCVDAGALSATAFGAAVTSAATGEMYSVAISKSAGGADVSAGNVVITQMTALTLGVPTAWAKSGTGPPSNSPFTYASEGPTASYYVYVSVPNSGCSTMYSYAVSIAIEGAAYIPATLATCVNVGLLSETVFGAAISGAAASDQYAIYIWNGGPDIVAGQVAVTQTTILTLGVPVAWMMAGAGSPSNSPFEYASEGLAVLYYVYVLVPNPSCSTTYNYTVTITRGGVAYVPTTAAVCINVGALSDTAFGAIITGASVGQLYSVMISKSSGGSDITTGQIVITSAMPYVIDGIPVPYLFALWT